MMNNQTYSFLVLLALFPAVSVAFAQSSSSEPPKEVIERPTVDSPQVWSMMRYDNPSVSLNTGSPYITIPLVDENDPDFDFKYSLVYSTPGFRPWVPDNYVGMGWILEGDGVIRREIRGIPDDCQNLPTGPHTASQSRMVSGFRSIYGTTAGVIIKEKLSAYDTTYLSSSVANAEFFRQGVTVCPVIDATNVELCPDIYHFRFGKHSGKFIIDFDGTVKAVGYDGGRYKVDLSDYSMKNCGSYPACNYNTQSAITIITDDGFRYTFGGYYDSMDYTAFSWADFLDYGGSYQTGNDAYDALLQERTRIFNRVTAYHLTRVVTPDGRTMEIEYYDDVPSAAHQEPTKMIFQTGPWMNDYSSLSKYYSIVPDYDFDPIRTYETKVNYTVNKIALIKEIRTDDKRVTFTYESRQNPFFCRGNYENMGCYDFVRTCGVSLSEVKVYSRISGKLLDDINLTYQESTGRLLLSEVHGSRRGRHQLSYYTGGPWYDKALTMDIDRWGFWSGYGANSKWRESAAGEEAYNTQTMLFQKASGDTNRDATGVAYKKFMLSSVTFPTGGTIEYDYEPHDYGKYYRQEYDTGYTAAWADVPSGSMLAGGARIKSEAYYAGDQEQEPRVHRFGYKKADGQTSSGVLLREGDNYLRAFVYGLYDPEFFPYSFIDSTLLYASPPPTSKCLNRHNGVGDYILYTSVTERDYSVGTEGKKVSIFSLPALTHGPHKPLYFLVPSVSRSLVKWYRRQSPMLIGNFLSCPEDNTYKSGKLLSETWYNESGNVVQSVIWGYTDVSQGSGLGLVGGNDASFEIYLIITPSIEERLYTYIIPFCNTAQIVATPLSASLPSSKLEYTYYPPGLGNTVYIKEEYYQYDNDGYLITTENRDSHRYRYFTEYEHPQHLASPTAAESRMVALNILRPVIHEVHKTEEDVTFRKDNVYALFGTGSMPRLSQVNAIYSSGAPEPRAIYTDYDGYGNSVAFMIDGRSYVMLWGYYGKYPVALIENATKQQVETVLSPKTLSSFSADMIPDEQTLRSLRVLLPDAMVSVFLYDPSVGMTLKITPDGQETGYSYDTKGRLGEVFTYDECGHKSVIEAYDYNIVNE